MQVVGIKVTVCAGKRTEAVVHELYGERLFLTHDERTEVNELCALQCGLITRNLQAHLYFVVRIGGFVRLHFEVKGISAVNQSLSVVLHRNLLAFARTHGAFSRSGLHHNAPVGVLRNSCYVPNELFSHIFVTATLQRFAELHPGHTVIVTEESILLAVFLGRHTRAERILLSGGELSHYPEAAARSKVELFVKVQVGTVSKVVVSYSFKERSLRNSH